MFVLMSFVGKMKLVALCWVLLLPLIKDTGQESESLLGFPACPRRRRKPQPEKGGHSQRYGVTPPLPD